MGFDSGMGIRLGALTPGVSDELVSRLNAAFQASDPVAALINAARAQGSDPGVLQQLDSQYSALRTQLGDTLSRIDSLGESEARSLVAALEQQSQGLRRRAESLAGERSLTGPVLWGAAIVLGAGGIAYVVWKATQKRRRNRRRR